MAKEVNVMTGVDAHGTPQFQSVGISGRDNRAQATTQTATNMANLALAKYQNDWNLEMWNRQNEYNSPAHQIALMKAAGLNPNLYAPEGMTAASVSSANMANAGAPQLNTSRGSQLAQNVMAALAEGKNIYDSYLGRKQYDLAVLKTQGELERMNYQNRETAANVAYIQGKTGLQKLEASNLEMDLRSKQSQIDQNYQNIQHLRQMDRESDEKIRKMYNDRMNDNARLRNESRELASKLKINEKTMSQIDESIRLTVLDQQMRGEQITYQSIMNGLEKSNADVAVVQNELKKDHATALFWKDYVIDVVDEGLSAINIVGKLLNTKQRNRTYQQQVDQNASNQSHLNPGPANEPPLPF